MKVFIDPGHGGTDPGAVANGIREKDVNLTVATLLRVMLEAYDIHVIMARDKDKTVSMATRTNLANGFNTDAFISIHHNAATNTAARGVEVFHSIVGGRGKELAELVHSCYRKLIPELPSRGVKTKKGSTGRDYYHVIRETKMPAIIIEGAFLSNPDDAKLVKQEEFLFRQAEAICQGVLLWYGLDIQKEGDNTPVDKGTPDKTPILGTAQATVAQAKEWAKHRGAHQRFIDIADIYWKYGNLTGIRAEVAYSQAGKETAFGKYGGAVTPEQNNWAGIKTKNAAGDRTTDHESFPTPEDGVRAHFNHLCAYVGKEPIGIPHERYYLVKTIPWAGTVKYVEELGGKWAPAVNYGVSIVSDYLQSLLATEAPKDDLDKLRAELEMLKAEIDRLHKIIDAVQDIIKDR